MNTDSLYKNKIGLKLATVLTDSFETGKITKDDASYLYSHILDELDLAKNSTEVFNFVLRLAEEWPIFVPVASDPSINPPAENQEQN